ncbi:MULTISPECIES: hypothetical protein [unclassified Lentimonas]|uniref:hypothetical protein n=1 Tax=unclassified Lentimonas TaxID=2630993 RepID=UPI00132274F2|nr:MULTISPECIES: hypothetical protein [unclassified Lentimonas]CAA6676365.1 Unannotated [Lentimonas sp. CC4]CAA6685203.1 Unannotated [Lentimonas sp. CC6]CAA6693383.1 Unannotated [Lentimonas sp. CC19]CAA6696497.1 Unannotated [Lentimonas sp. CC10]CAA7072401.1 Unannotated [Lentimonas sp. CC11]
MKLLPIVTFLALSFSALPSIAIAGRAPAERDFKIVEREQNKDTGTFQFYRRTLRGTERTNNSMNRLSMLSEDQGKYPTPQSACGPTAMLNILVWYEKYGLIQPSFRDANTENYKFKLFREIDSRLSKQTGSVRTEENGVSDLDTAMVMDAIVRENSKNEVRIHTDIIKAPLKLNDLIDTMQNFRSGYLIVTPKSHSTGKMLNDHAATLIRADRSGYITLATWGQLYRGLLKKRPDGQWFIPQDPTHMELKVQAMMRFIPFRPTTPEDR